MIRNLIFFSVAFVWGLGVVAIFERLDSSADFQEVSSLAQNLLDAPATTNRESQVEDRFEYFVDQKLIGRLKKNKVEIRCFERGESNFAEIKFFSRSRNGSWLEKQSFKFEKDHLSDCDPKITDFNNDGLGDLSYGSNVAARGANEIRKLFIYDKKHDELVFIKNSEDFPNLLYNKKLDCLDSWMIHGATTTLFLEIDGDALREFARVNTGADLTVEVLDSNGKWRFFAIGKMNKDAIYTRYIDYYPVTPYK